MGKIQTILTALLLCAAPATAQSAMAESEAPDLRKSVECGPIGEVRDVLKDVGKIDAEHRTLVDLALNPRFFTRDGGALPDRVWLRGPQGETDIVMAANGDLPDLVDRVFEVEAEELCVSDPTRAGRSKDDSGLEFQLGALPQYLERDGSHTLEQLAEGNRQGRKFYKRMAPGVVSIFIPKMTHLAVSHPRDDVDALPQVVAWRGGERLGPVEMERFDVSQLLAISDLQEMGATIIEIIGPYRLYPMPSPDIIRRFGGGQPDVDQMAGDAG